VKKLILVGLVCMLALTVVGCGDGENDQVTEGNQEAGETAASEPQEPTPETIPETSGNVLMKVVDHLRSQGLEVIDIHEKSAELIGAVEGLGFDVAGGPAEIYLFDPETAEADLVDNLDNARTTEKFMVNTREVSSVMNGNIMLTGYEIGMVVHPEKDKLVEAFKNFNE